jgi:hypothetical protein
LWALFNALRRAQLGRDDIPLATVVGRATPLLAFRSRDLHPQVQAIVTEYQRRWSEILSVPPGASRVHFTSDEIAARVAEQFPLGDVGWVTALYQSPDFMLAATDPEAVERGDYLLVLGELHLSDNTMESRVFAEQHDDQSTMLAAESADLGDQRIYMLPPWGVPWVTSRVSPPGAYLAPQWRYWTMYRESAYPPAPITPAADLVVFRENNRLMVRSTRGPFRATLLAVLADSLAGIVVNAFKPVARGVHSPRVTIDRLVVSRESWTFRADEVAWANATDEADRFLGARAWRLAHGLPERAFYKVPVEDKPAFVDFASVALLNLLAKSIRRSVAEPDGRVTLTEMLPDLPNLWLRDADGGRYTSEFRMCAVDQRGMVIER